MQTENQRFGLRLNFSKKDNRIQLEKRAQRKSKKCIYLGQNIDDVENRKPNNRIKRRIRQSNTTFEKLNFIIKNKNIQKKSFKVMLMCYGAENWSIEQKNMNNIPQSE